MAVCPSVPGCVALLRAPRSERSPRPGSSPRLEKELETLENSSSVASTKENLAEVAAVPAKEEKAEIVPNAQKVGTAKPCGQGGQGVRGRGAAFGGVVLGASPLGLGARCRASPAPNLALLSCRVPWAQP